MQRTPQNRSEGNEEVMPLVKLARRIRAEQGAAQLKAFLQAMTPFFAPNELKNIAADFGVAYPEASPQASLKAQPQPPVQPAQQARDPMEMIRSIMQLKTLMSGGDAQALMRLLGGK